MKVSARTGPLMSAQGTPAMTVISVPKHRCFLALSRNKIELVTKPPRSERALGKDVYLHVPKGYLETFSTQQKSLKGLQQNALGGVVVLERH